MGFKYTNNTMFNIALALKDKSIKQIVNPMQLDGLTFVKDYLPNGAPCWRLPTQEEINEFKKEKSKNEIQ